ncbi:hypothetical protein NB689_002455 [Xanthomonas sacchari]|nr:hypothetical protein [Xanthomonas sacchari]
MADQVGLLGGLGDDAVTGGQRRGDLAEEDGQREIPRADAHEHTAAVQLQFVGFAGRPGQALGRTELRARLAGVVAQEIHRLAHFGDAVGQGLAGFLDAQRHELGHARFQQVGGVFEDGGAAGGRGAVPGRISGRGIAQRLLHGGGIGRLPVADDLAMVGRVGDRQGVAGDHRAGHQRRGLPGLERGVELVGQRAQIVVVGEVGAHGVLPVVVLAAQQIDRQRNLRMRDGGERGHGLDRIADQVFDGHVFVGDAVDEAGVGAVLQQAPHQVGQQVLVRTHRRVHAAGHAEAVGGDHFGIEVVAHAVQLLVLVVAAAGDGAHRGDGLRVVGGEHRIQRIAVREQALGAGQVGHIGVLLAGEHRIARVALDLRALDLRVPVGALDQAHRDAAADAARQVGEEIDRVRGALLVCLHRQAVAFPTVQRGIGEGGLDDVQRQFQAVGFFGVDRVADAVGLGQLRQFQYAGHQFGHHPRTLGVLVARIQRRELDRDAGCGEHRVLAAALLALRGEMLADGMDRLAVGIEIALRVLHGQRAFAEHVERVAVVGVVALLRAGQRLADGPAHHELMAHDLHRLAHRQTDHRLADAADQTLERAGHVGAGEVVDLHQLAGEHQAPGRRIDQDRIALAHVLLPVRIAELVADQLVGGVLVGDAQQRFGHAHQQHAFLAAEVVLAHEGLDRALVLGAGAHPGDQVGGQRLHPGLVGRGQARLLEQFAYVFGFVLEPGGGDRRAQGLRRGREFGGQQGRRRRGRHRRNRAGARQSVHAGKARDRARYFMSAPARAGGCRHRHGDGGRVQAERTSCCATAFFVVNARLPPRRPGATIQACSRLGHERFGSGGST